MKKVFESVTRVFNILFHDRKIVIVSEGKVSTIGISRRFQIVAILLLVAGLGWMPFSAGKLVAFNDLSNKKAMIRDISDVEQRVEVLQNDIMLLEEYLRALHKYDNFEIGAKKKTSVQQSSSGDQTEDEIARIENKRDEIMHDLKGRTVARIKAIEGFLKSANLNYTKITGKKQIAVVDHKEAVGGPFIAADSDQNVKDSGDDSYLSAQFIDEMNYLYELQKIVNNLPFSNPIAYNKISSNYGIRTDPFNGRYAMHSGIDLAANSRASISSTGPGRVTYVGRKGAYGLMVEVYHGYGFTTRYGHLSAAKVKAGDYVTRGQIIATQGCTGRCTGDHLHYEVRINDRPVNPLTYLLKAGDIQYYYAKKL